ncbi:MULTISPECIES: hypothetical protein [Maribacter]|uniref:Uncharacterized protein n=1 Tax=Maribacter flavus TaxID=1658664 RepID=A0ABU7IKF9_9FLAO|nr:MULTISPECIES: hypothetical protein [Maribacter]MDC6406317.1 hypothetical protein [Maribacter sp. PR66]MEE1973437.1 hypothetical protein [Maribacter flavus]
MANDYTFGQPAHNKIIATIIFWESISEGLCHLDRMAYVRT